MGSADLIVMLATIGALLFLGASTTRMGWRQRLIASGCVLALTGWHVFT